MKVLNQTFTICRLGIIGGFFALALPFHVSAATYSLTAFGAVGDGAVANATKNRNAFVSALAFSGNTITVPAGTFMIDNSTLVAIDNFSGSLIFDPNATFVLTNPNGANGIPDRFGGIYFSGGTGATIQGIRITWNYPAGTLRDNLVYAALKFAYTANTMLNGAVIQGSRSAGIQFYACSNPVAQNIRVTNALADGLDFFNVKNGTAVNVYTSGTGDDGLAFVAQSNTGQYENWTGGSATNITVLNSYARGISVVGAQNVSINNFFVSNTTSSGILIDYEPSYNDPSQLPNNVTFSNGTIAGAGQNGPTPPSVGYPTPTRGNRFGVEINIDPPTLISSPSAFTVSNVRITGSYSRGMSAYMGSNLPGGMLTAKGVYSGTGHDGFVMRVPQANLSNLVSQSNQYYGMYLYSVGTVSAQNLFSFNDSLAPDSLNRAFWVDPPTGPIVASNICVVDTKPVATGYIVGEAGATGSLSGIQFNIPNGTLAVDQWGSGMSFTRPIVTPAIAMPSITGYNALNPSPTILAGTTHSITLQ